MIVEKMWDEDHIYHYSDAEMMMRRVETGELYENAIDIVPCPYTYEETDIPVDGREEPYDAEKDMINALEILEVKQE